MPDFHLEIVASSICTSRNYTFVRGEGAGSFKETFLIINESGTREALKVVKAGHSSARTEREIDAMRRCVHPNIAKLKDVDIFHYQGEEYLFMVEEYLPGGTLSERIETEQLSAEEVHVLGFTLIRAVEHIASHALVHRDIKPDNILFREDGITPVIVDFGLVRNLSEYSLTPSWGMRGPGTPFFAAPEQLNNEKELIDWRTDQFSLGIVLSLCVLGRHPFKKSVHDSPSDVVERVARRESLESDIVRQFEERGFNALTKMIAPWPVDRFRTPSNLIAAWSENNPR